MPAPRISRSRTLPTFAVFALTLACGPPTDTLEMSDTEETPAIPALTEADAAAFAALALDCVPQGIPEPGRAAASQATRTSLRPGS